MAVDLMGYTRMEDQIAIQEAAAAGLRSMEHLIFQLSAQKQQNHHHQQQQQSGGQNKRTSLDCREITDFTVSKFRKVISILDRTGHARFRRAPPAAAASPSAAIAAAASTTSSPATLDLMLTQPTPAAQHPQTQSLTLDFTKPKLPVPSKPEISASSCQFSKDTGFSISQPTMSSANSSFLSSITGDPSVSNGKLGTSLFLGVAPAGAAAAAVPSFSAGKPPLSASFKKRCHGHSDDISGKYGGRCHCSKRRKNRVKKTIRVPAISSKMADIPPDEYSWRKYGQKPIKGSPYPRGYYKGVLQVQQPERVPGEEARGEGPRRPVHADRHLRGRAPAHHHSQHRRRGRHRTSPRLHRHRSRGRAGGQPRVRVFIIGH